MQTDSEDLPAPAGEQRVDPVAVLTTDEHAGKGGSYLFDPATGARTLVVEEIPVPTEKE